MLYNTLQTHWFLSRGQRLAARRRFPEACDTLARAAALRPADVGVALHWALSLAELGQTARAVEVLQPVLPRQPDNPVLPMFLAQILFDAADYPAAEAWCERALHLNPSNTHALALQALIAMARGQISTGAHRLLQPPPQPMTGLEHLLLRLAPGAFLPLVQWCNAAMQSRLLWFIETCLWQQDIPSQTLTQQLLAATPPSTLASSMVRLDRLCTRGIMGLTRAYTWVRYVGRAAERVQHLDILAAEEAYYLGDAVAAQARYTRLCQQGVETATIQERLFDLYYEQGDFARALRILQQLLARQATPDGPGAWEAFMLGELLCQAGQYDAAAAPLSRAQTLGLRDARLLYYLGLCRLRQGAPREARVCFADAVQELNPTITWLRLQEMCRVLQIAPPPPALPPAVYQSSLH